MRHTRECMFRHSDYPVCVAEDTESIARERMRDVRKWPNQNAIGKRIRERLKVLTGFRQSL